MNTIEIRKAIYQYVDQLDDRFLKAVLAMLKTYSDQKEEDPIIGYDPVDGTPLKASFLQEELAKEVKAAKRGEYITVEELDKRSKKWLDRTK